ncbi:MAG: M20/M25/M40 family metallo-hydrolase [Eubacterium sp.]|nr:M20/M25/M40 family metallo-hydrolase [Eubacterium sp.]
MIKTILLIILALFAAFVVITFIRAAFFKTPVPEVEPMPEERVDATRVQEHLSQAIQIKTISNVDESKVDWNEFKRFHDFLEKEFPLTHKTLKREVVSKASLLFTWEGANPGLDGIAFLSHQDVVPIEEGTEGDWEHPPFDGYNDGEFIWGRGSIDMKNHLICVIEAVESLLEDGFVPERTVYLCFGHNEEIVAGENNGAQALMETLKERDVRLDSTIDEGGAILPANIKGILKGNLAGVGIAEKGNTDIRVTVHAKGGHSSQPPVHTGAGMIGDVVHDLEKHQFKATMLPMVKDMFTLIGKRMSYPGRLVACNIAILKPLLLAVAKRIPPAASFIRTTTACTMLKASPAANVLPQTASVTINFRQLPGTTTEDLFEHIRKVCRNKDIDIEFIKGKEASAVSPTDTRAFETLTLLSHQIDRYNIVAPYLVMGGTDTYHYEDICDNLYRYSPFVFGTSLLLTTHSTNERCPVDQLAQGVTFFKRYIKIMASK